MPGPKYKARERSLNRDRLNGWKEISNWLGKSVRTAQRWEKLLSLPVHRIHTPRGEIVFGSTTELDRWQVENERDSRRASPPSEDHTTLARLALLPESEFAQVLGSRVSKATRAELVCQACLTLQSNGQQTQPLDSRRALAVLERLARSPDSTIARQARSALRRLHHSRQQ